MLILKPRGLLHCGFCLPVQNLALVSKVEAMAKEKGCTTGQLALAWLLAKNPFVYPIPGTKVRELGELLAGAGEGEEQQGKG